MEILLFINDNILINISITNFLSSKGYKIVSCTSGKKAIELASQKDFDLAIIDLNLPNFSVREAVTEIRKIKKEMPIVALYSLEIDIEEEIKKEICHILPDNIQEDKLLEVIEECLGKRKG